MSRSLDVLHKRVYRRRESEASAATYVRRVRGFAGWFRMEPDVLLEEFRSGRRGLKESFETYLDARVGEVSRGYLSDVFTSVRKWLKVNGVEVDVKWREFDLPVYPTVGDRIPTKEEIRNLSEFASLRMQMALTFLTSSGVRSGAFVGLKLGNLDLERYGDIGRVEVPIPLDKTRKGYYTFLTPEAVNKLRKYLGFRERKGEELTDESPVFATGHMTDKRLGSAVGYSTLQLTYHLLLKKAGLAQKSHGWYVLHLHTLRKYFRTTLGLCGLSRPIVDTLMGHRGRGMDPAYWRPREREVLKAYRKAVPSLTISESEQLRDALHRRDSEYRQKLLEMEYASRRKQDVIDDLIKRVEALERED